MAEKKYKLKKDRTISPFGAGSLLDDFTMTDEIAEYLIKNGRASEEDFEKPTKKEK